MRFTPAKRTLLLTLLLVMLLAIALFIWSTMTQKSYRTEDAYITADYTLVAPKISGYIANVNVTDNQQVKAGDLLATLDDRDWKPPMPICRSVRPSSSALKLSWISNKR